MPKTEQTIVPTFAGGTLDRADQVRVSPDRLRAAMMNPRARLLKLDGLNPVFDAYGDLAWGAAFEASPDNDLLLLGIDEDIPYFAELNGAGDAGPAANRALWQTLGALPAEQAAIYATARSLVDWHARHKFCAQCGKPTGSRKGGWARLCDREQDGCGAEHFPRTDPVAIMLSECEGKVLLGRQPRFPPKSFSALAGFLEPGESIEGCVKRELFEEAGIHVHDVRYVASQPWPFPSSLMIACTSHTDDPTLTLDEEEIEEAAWFTLAEVKAAMAGDPDALFVAPPPFAIAHDLLKHWVDSKS
ncbi:NAD(+) diphosphatase [Sphingorhabdus sp. 109]|jgi:NAD+ diphosphatase|uniref:NAD(+) diphosphatase n=1 Tax=Sphingorhabdus sp. 109 TaxID=2653173 RepID=UPI0012F0F5CC|nr:NAD(+) diphosphatase [Sphingorhabdus sp. 109]VWX59085.1 NADH pyrophosphatase [Sphingorhabdus sp. 109]